MPFWITALGRTGTRLAGKTCLLGPRSSFQKAQDLGDRLMTQYDVHDLPTTNPGTATRLLKAQGIEASSDGNWEAATENVRHPSVEVFRDG